MYTRKKVSNHISTFLKNQRKIKQLTQEDLAALLKMDYKYLQRLESLKRSNNPELETLIKIANTFKVKLKDIFKGI